MNAFFHPNFSLVLTFPISNALSTDQPPTPMLKIWNWAPPLPYWEVPLWYDPCIKTIFSLFNKWCNCVVFYSRERKRHTFEKNIWMCFCISSSYISKYKVINIGFQVYTVPVPQFKCPFPSLYQCPSFPPVYIYCKRFLVFSF